MPIFEFKCTVCGKHFEKILKTSSELPPECPVCGSGDVTKEMSVFSATAKSSAAACFSGG